MKGGIYTRQKCPVCKVVMRDNHRNGVVCPICNEHSATRFIVKFGKVFKNHTSYTEAQRELNGMRYNTDQGSFDERDYKKGNPLSFDVLSEKWLKKIKNKRAHGTYTHYKNYISKAITYWGTGVNIKNIGYAELEDFFDDLHENSKLASKTIYDIKTVLHAFFVWFSKREKRGKRFYEVPEFPELNYQMGYRKLVNKETQQEIIAKVKELTYHLNPRIWLGIKWLCTYVAIRPGALRKLTEYEVNAESGYFHVPSSASKEKTYRIVPMLQEDRDIVLSFPKAIDSELPFFRQLVDRRGVKAGKPFGLNTFYKWWKKACNELGIKGVDLYGGTKHSTVTALRKKFSPEQIKKYGTQHTTNKAFDRYLMVDIDESLDVYAEANNPATDGAKVATVLQPDFTRSSK